MSTVNPMRRVVEFVQTESAAGIVLIGATVVALLWANVAPGSYQDFWSTGLSLPGPDHTLTLHDVGRRRAHGRLLLRGRTGDQA